MRLVEGGFGLGVLLVSEVGVGQRTVDDVVGLVLGGGLLHGGDGFVVLLVILLLGGLHEQGVEALDLLVLLLICWFSFVTFSMLALLFGHAGLLGGWQLSAWARSKS